jgi:ferrous iron transport protein A
VKEPKLVTAAQMVVGQVGAVESIDGGHLMRSRLAALGFRPGKRVHKVRTSFMRGPSVFEVDGSSIAVGFGMASRILIKTY